MKTLKWLSSSLLVCLLMTSCFIDIDDDEGLFGCVDGDGPIITEEIFLDDFDGIRVPSSIDVYLSQGDNVEIIVEGKENLIDELERNVSGGIWTIDFDDCVRDVDRFDVYITMPTLKSVKCSGSGDVYGENEFTTGDLELKTTGSGNIDLQVFADDLDIHVSGSGDISLEGTADDAKYRSTGSGDVKAFDLETNTADISGSGSGDLEVRVIDFLKVRLSGSGDVFYKGNPELDVSTSGSGDVIDAN